MNLVNESLDTFITERYNNNSVNTNNANKNLEEEKTYNVIKNIMGSPAKWIGLVGQPGEGNFERHVKMCADLGISSNDMIIIERDEDIYSDLCKENNLKQYKCVIRQGDFKDILDELLKKGYMFSVVDFDATSPMTKYEIELLDIFEKHVNQIDVLRIVVQTREKNLDEEYKEISKKLNLKLYYSPTYIGPWKKIILSQCTIPEVVQEIEKDTQLNKSGKKNYALTMYTLKHQPDMILSEYCKSKKFYCLFENYKGESVMRNFVISKNEKLLNYKTSFDTLDIATENVYGHTIEIVKATKRKFPYYLINQEIFKKGFGPIASVNKKSVNTFGDFKLKYRNLINKGKIKISVYKNQDKNKDIIIFSGAYNSNTGHYEDTDVLINASKDARILGFKTGGYGAGVYTRDKAKKEVPVEIPVIQTSKQITDAVKKIISNNDINQIKELINSSKYNVSTDFLSDLFLLNLTFSSQDIFD